MFKTWDSAYIVCYVIVLNRMFIDLHLFLKLEAPGTKRITSIAILDIEHKLYLLQNTIHVVSLPPPLGIKVNLLRQRNIDSTSLRNDGIRD